MAPLLTPEQAAKHLGIGEDTLRALRKAGEIPYVNVGLGQKRETPRYEVADLDAWVQRRKTVASRPPAPGRGRGAPPGQSGMVADFLARLEEHRSQSRKR